MNIRSSVSLNNLIHIIKKINYKLNPKSILILGPWMGEVGSELQYWIPYLRMMKHKGYFGSKKIIAISRGGVNLWYEDIADKYIEIFKFISEKEYIKIREESIKVTKKQKQTKWSNGEFELIKKIVKNQGIQSYDIIHPSLMWFDILPWVRGQINLNSAYGYLEFKAFTKKNNKFNSIIKRLKIKKHFIVAKFYTNELFSFSTENLNFINKIFRLISNKYQIVILESSVKIDNHKIFKNINKKNIIRVGQEFKLSENLGLQTEIIEKSKGFIGTSGGFALLPLYLGKSSISFHSEKIKNKLQNFYQHETMTRRSMDQLSPGNYNVIHISAWNNISENIFNLL